MAYAKINLSFILKIVKDQPLFPLVLNFFENEYSWIIIFNSSQEKITAEKESEFAKIKAELEKFKKEMEQNETRLNAYNRQNNDLKEENKELKQNEAKNYAVI